MDKFVRRLSGPPVRASNLTGERLAKRARTEGPEETDGVNRDSSKKILDERKAPISFTSHESHDSATTDNYGDDDDNSNSDSCLLFDCASAATWPLEGDDPSELFGLSDLVDEETPRIPDESQQIFKGRHRSIYVDAFETVLDTVLAQEEHLFSENEKAVFVAWKGLDYEAQYLYVRLFLRKESAWHRTQRLGYYSDISDLPAAVNTLQHTREMPKLPDDAVDASVQLLQGWALGPSYSFIETFDSVPASVHDALSLLSLDELKLLAKGRRVGGKNKAGLLAALVESSVRQTTLPFARLRNPGPVSDAGAGLAEPDRPRPEGEDQLFTKAVAITGPCIRVSQPVFKLFERVLMVFYRTPEWTENSLKVLILAMISKRNFPEYVVSRTANIFPSRQHLLDFEVALRLQYKVDQIMGGDGPVGEEGFQQIVGLFDSITARWRELVRNEQQRHMQRLDAGDDAYLRRFQAAHVYTRIAHYAAFALGRLGQSLREHALLCELLGQRVFGTMRRGAWYQRKALIEERYMPRAMAASDPSGECGATEAERKRWQRAALATCEEALQDRDCHLIFHYDLQKRVSRLEKRLRIPRRLQHDFGHLRLRAPEEHFVEGVQTKKDGGQQEIGTKTTWLVDGCEDDVACSVEEMCLDYYRRHGWKGYHTEGGIVRTLFAYLFCDILFLPVPNVFQTAYQSYPLDLGTDAFYAARASEINQRLVEIANGEAARIVRDVHATHAQRRPSIVGLQWDFELEDLAELARCFRGDALAIVCKVLAQEYRQRGGGLPDLLLWRMEPCPEVLFAEVKSASDRLSDTQRMWIHVLAGAGVRVAVCHAVAREVRVKSEVWEEREAKVSQPELGYRRLPGQGGDLKR